MAFELPALGQDAIPLEHFPTRLQAFIFRAYEYIPVDRIAALLHTSAKNIRQIATDMGLQNECFSNIWLEKGYITIIRRMWHLLPYEQLLELLDMDEQELAITLREDDFLDVKLGKKPVCEKLVWEELTEEQEKRTKSIKAAMKMLSIDGAEPFKFSYDVDEVKFSGKQLFDLRMVYTFSGLYLHAFDVDSREYCPDEMLEAYQKVGINAVWAQAVLYQLTEFPFRPELSVGYEQRLKRLKDFTERCDKYGIKVLLYINEPRSMSKEFFDKYPKMKGHSGIPDKTCMCTSTFEVQKYLTEAIEAVCRAVPLLGGFFCITRSENPTNCYSHSNPDTCQCSLCKNRSVGEVIGEVISCIEKGAHSVNPDINVIAWDWGWNEYNLDVIEHLPDKVILMAQSELHVPYTFGGVSGHVTDYSMSVIGPGKRAKEEWAAARKRGLKTAAKVQVNTTWECSTVPALPVYPHIERHIQNLKEEGVSNLMLSWTLGGYPSRNIQYISKYFYEKYERKPEDELEKQAAELFSEAFQHFPFHVEVLYLGPQNAGPSTLLFEKPTGYKATMTCYAYDDLEGWTGIYTPEILEAQFERVCEKWMEGLELLKNEPYGQMKIMAEAAYCLFKSSLNQIKFYRARETDDKKTMCEMAKQEIESAKKMLTLMNMDASIGYEAANHYYFSKGCLCEKVINCNHIIESLGL